MISQKSSEQKPERTNQCQYLKSATPKQQTSKLPNIKKIIVLDLSKKIVISIIEAFSQISNNFEQNALSSRIDGNITL